MLFEGVLAGIELNNLDLTVSLKQVDGCEHLAWTMSAPKDDKVKMLGDRTAAIVEVQHFGTDKCK